MNHSKRRQLVWSCALLVGLSAFAAPQAEAHGRAYVPAPYYERYVDIDDRRYFPRWLRKDRDFRRWYKRSHFHHVRYIGWQRLYDLYLIDRYQQRRLNRHYKYSRNKYRDHHRYRDRYDRRYKRKYHHH